MNTPQLFLPKLIDVADLIEVICGLRQEAYPYERYVSLLTFSAWLRWPSDPDIIKQARIVSMARIIVSLQYGKIKRSKNERQLTIEALSAHGFTLLDAAHVLVNPALTERFWSSYNRSMTLLFDVAMIANFFLRCGSETPSSLNKALFFIEEGGFEKDFEIGYHGNIKPYRFSQARVKRSWHFFSSAASFVLAAEMLPLKEVLYLPPDSDLSVIHTGKLLRNGEKLIRYFSLAKSVHDALMQHLDHRSLGRITLVRFPEAIKASKAEVTPFDTDQLAL
jgi:hypothetical protein